MKVQVVDVEMERVEASKGSGSLDGDLLLEEGSSRATNRASFDQSPGAKAIHRGPTENVATVQVTWQDPSMGSVTAWVRA